MAGNNKNIIFTGNQTGSVLWELFSNALLFIQPSESEGLSIALLEAMSFGRPVLASNIPENKEALARDGYYFKNADAGDLAKKLSGLISKPGQINVKGIKGKDRVNRFYNWDKITDETIEFYGEAGKEKNLGMVKAFSRLNS